MEGFFALGNAVDLPPRRRRHTSQACDPCSRRKIRCDSASPVCSACAWRGNHDNCQYTIVHQRRGPKPLQVKQSVKTNYVRSNNFHSPTPPITARQPPEKSNKRRKTIISAPSSPVITLTSLPSFPPSITPSMPDVDDNESVPVPPDELTPELERQLLTAFLETYYPSSPLRVIHRPTVKKNLDTIEPVLSSGMCAIAARFGAVTEPLATKLSNYYYSRCRSLIIQQLDEPTLDTITGLLWLVMYAAAVYDTSKGWNYAGMAVRMAQYMRLNIDPDDLVPATMMSWIEKERYRRVWWAICVLDHCVACFAGGPKIVEEDEITTAMPANEELWEGPEYATSYGMPANMATSNPFTSTIYLLRLFFYAQEHNAKPSSLRDHDHAELTKINSRIDDWVSFLPETLRPGIFHFSTSLSDIDYIRIASILLCHSACVLTLHRRHMLEELSTENIGGSTPSTSICVRAADRSTAAIRWLWRLTFSPLWNIFTVYCVYQTALTQIQIFRHLRDHATRYRILRGAEVHATFLETTAPHMPLARKLASDLYNAIAVAEHDITEEESKMKKGIFDRLMETRVADTYYDFKALMQAFM